jgi:hypothetical protein
VGFKGFKLCGVPTTCSLMLAPGRDFATSAPNDESCTAAIGCIIVCAKHSQAKQEAKQNANPPTTAVEKRPNLILVIGLCCRPVESQSLGLLPPQSNLAKPSTLRHAVPLQFETREPRSRSCIQHFSSEKELSSSERAGLRAAPGSHVFRVSI